MLPEMMMITMAIAVREDGIGAALGEIEKGEGIALVIGTEMQTEKGDIADTVMTVTVTVAATVTDQDLDLETESTDDEDRARGAGTGEDMMMITDDTDIALIGIEKTIIVDISFRYRNMHGIGVLVHYGATVYSGVKLVF